MADKHLVIFAKAPRYGTVKSRLARDIGKAEALRFYRTSLHRLTRRLAADRRWRTWLAVTPDLSALDDGAWMPGVPRLRQGAGDLGARMQRVMDFMPPGPAVIVGSDIPGIRPVHIDRAFRALGAHNTVLGPTPDGGYWLIGLKRVRRTPALFENVRWSSGHEFGDTLKNVPSPVGIIDTLNDVDVAADLPLSVIASAATQSRDAERDAQPAWIASP